MSKAKPRPASVICLWEWGPARSGWAWNPVDAYARDEAGTPIGPHKSPEDFMEEGRSQGRLVTMWTPLHGVLCHSLSAPHQVAFLGEEFYKQIRASPTWWLFLHDGTALMQATALKGAEIMYGAIEED